VRRLATELSEVVDLLSTFARRINDHIGLTGRGQKSASSRKVYRHNAKRSWKLRRLN